MSVRSSYLESTQLYWEYDKVLSNEFLPRFRRLAQTSTGNVRHLSVNFFLNDGTQSKEFLEIIKIFGTRLTSLKLRFLPGYSRLFHQSQVTFITLRLSFTNLFIYYWIYIFGGFIFQLQSKGVTLIPCTNVIWSLEQFVCRQKQVVSCTKSFFKTNYGIIK